MLKSSPNPEQQQCDGMSQYDAPDADTHQIPVQEPYQQVVGSLHQGLPGECNNIISTSLIV